PHHFCEHKGRHSGIRAHVPDYVTLGRPVGALIRIHAVILSDGWRKKRQPGTPVAMQRGLRKIQHPAFPSLDALNRVEEQLPEVSHERSADGVPRAKQDSLPPLRHYDDATGLPEPDTAHQGL